MPLPCNAQRSDLTSLLCKAGKDLAHRLESASARPALRAAGGKGPLAQEEARWLRLRTEKEGEAIEELKRQRSVLEAEASKSQREGQLCATPFGVDVVGITEFVALTGALVGGGLSQQSCACRLHAGSCMGGPCGFRGVACCVLVAEDRRVPLGAPALAGTCLGVSGR